MKIVHLCLCGPYNDNWGYQENIIPKYNRKDGHEVTVITSTLVNSTKNHGYERTSAKEYYLEDGIKVIRLPFIKFFIKNLIERLRIYKNLYQTLKNENPDLIFVHEVSFWNVDSVIKYKMSKKNVKIYADNHADYENSARNLISKYLIHRIIWKSRYKKFMPHCEKIFGVTPNRCEFLSEMYSVSKDKIDLLVMGADTEKINFDNKEKIKEEIRSSLSITKDDFVIITGGKIDEKKNIHNLIMAVNEIANSNIKLIVFGTAIGNIKEIIESLSSTKYVNYIGWINSDKAYDYFLASDLAFFPGTHSVLWEQAVGTGIPCVFKKWKGMDHVDVGGNCEFINDGTVEEIKSIILNIFNNQYKYNQMRNNTIKRGINYFSYEKISRRAIGK